MGTRKKVVVRKVNGVKVLEEIDVEAFNKLPIAKKSARKAKVDYDKLVTQMDGKVLTIAKIGKLMIATSNGQKTKVYYSEVLSSIARLQKQKKITFERRGGVGTPIYYFIHKV